MVVLAAFLLVVKVVAWNEKHCLAWSLVLDTQLACDHIYVFHWIRHIVVMDNIRVFKGAHDVNDPVNSLATSYWWRLLLKFFI